MKPFSGALFAGAVSGVLLTLAYPPLRWSAIAWCALLPLYLSLSTAERRWQGALAGFSFGCCLFLAGAAWIQAAGVIPWVILSALMGLLFALFGVVFAWLLPTVPIPLRPWVFAALWVLAEWLRSQGGYAFPWFVLAATQARELVPLQIVSLTGQWGLTFALALTAALLGEAWRARKSRSSALRFAALAAAVPGVVYSLGYGLLQQERQRTEPRDFTVGVAQGSFLEPSPGGDYWSEVLATYLELSRKAALTAEDRPLDLLLWPEGVTPDNLLLDNYSLPPIQSLARSLQLPMLIGTTHEENGLRYNSAVLLDRNGQPLGRYDKTHIVPVGEFFPFRPLLQAVYLQYNIPENDFAPGRLPNVIRLPGASPADGAARSATDTGILICYDVAFPGDSRAAVRRGAQFFAQITADSPFETTARPEQHADLTALRTVETRRWMVRAALSGISQVVDPTGREVASLPVLARDVLRQTIALRNDVTLYVLWGDWFVVLCGAAALAGFGSALCRSKPALPYPPPSEGSSAGGASG